MAAYRLAGDASDLVGAYENDLWEIGQLPDHKVLWGARWFLVHVGEPQAFAELPVAEQLALEPRGAPVHRVADLDSTVAAERRTIWWRGGRGWASSCPGTGRYSMPCS